MKTPNFGKKALTRYATFMVCVLLVVAQSAKAIDVGRRTAMKAAGAAALSGLMPVRVCIPGAPKCLPETLVVSEERIAGLASLLRGSSAIQAVVARFSPIEFATPSDFVSPGKDSSQSPLFHDWFDRKNEVYDRVLAIRRSDRKASSVDHDHFASLFADQAMRQLALERLADAIAHIEAKLSVDLNIPRQKIEDEVDFILACPFQRDFAVQSDGTLLGGRYPEYRNHHPLGRSFMFHFLDAIQEVAPEVANQFFISFQLDPNSQWGHFWLHRLSPSALEFLNMNYKIATDAPDGQPELDYAKYRKRTRDQESLRTTAARSARFADSAPSALSTGKRAFSSTRRAFFSLPNLIPAESGARDADCADFFLAQTTEAQLSLEAPNPLRELDFGSNISPEAIGHQRTRQ